MTEAHEPARIIYSAVAVANWFIGRNREENGDLTHLKLQKLLYFAQGWHLAYNDVPLFEDPIEAWKYGPVVRPVYRALSSRPKNESITEPIEGYVLRGGDYTVLGTPEMISRGDDTERLMRSVWKSYSGKRPWELVAITHAKGSPWDIVANSSGNVQVNAETSWFSDYYDLIIPVELMRSYFKSFLPKAE
ncbi:MAG: DUF4065 domain-containing protein [Deltaproteobacteria bacterium]|jgi:uncharacterized phage-associated protein|nr:DUF4065 domain-containing protein [Deltaproteobacteria bacterium]